MKHGVIVLVSILALALSPAAVPAQGFLGGGLPTLPGLPSFGNMFGGGGSCDPCADPSPFGLFGTVGWNYQTMDLSFRTLSAGLFDIGALKHTYKFSGVELGLAAKAVSRTGFGALARFTILATSSTKDTENYNEAMGGGFFFEGSRHWRAKNDTYQFDGMGFYNMYGRAAVIGGFRWNHLETSFDRPDGAIAIASLPGDEAVLTTNVFQPYVGAMIDQGGTSYVLKLGVIGWPQLYGSAKYGQTVGGAFGVGGRINGKTAKVNEGYFWEMFGEYGLRNQMFRGAVVSVFSKWTQYHLKGTFNADEDAIGGVPASDSDYWNISMHRNSFTAGLKVDIPLALPLPFNL
ncbi:MAG: hypothetical protein V1792_15935 [Pseudomonadota bacterium]